MSATAPATGLPPHWIRRGVFAALAAALVYAVFLAFADFQALRESLQGFALWTVPAALFSVIVGYALRAARWQLYLHRMGVLSPLGASALVFLSGFAMGVTPGKMGEVVKAYYLRETTGTPYTVSIPAVFAERVSDMVSVALLVGVGLFFVPAFGLPLGLLAMAGVLGGLLLLRSRRPAKAVLRLVARIPRVGRAAAPIGAMHDNLRPLLSGRLLVWSSLLGLVGWGFEALAMFLLAHGLGLELTWGQCAFVFATSTIAGVLSFMPGGLGVTEGGMVALLGLLGVALAPATALTLLIRLCTLWFGVGLGMLAIVLLRWIWDRHGHQHPSLGADRTEPPQA